MQETLPIKIKFAFNKPRLVTLITPDMFGVLTQMAQMGLIDESGIRDILGLEDLDKETMSKGEAGQGDPGRNKWYQNFRQPISINLWPEELARMNDTWKAPDEWPAGTPKEITDRWKSPAELQWSQAGKTLQSAKKDKSAL